MGDAENCPGCGRLVDEHLVSELRVCLSDLSDHDLPFEEFPEQQRTLDVVNAGSVAVQASVHDSPMGSYPVLVFNFSDPSGPLPPIALILDETHMRSVRTLVGQAIDAALLATRRRRNR